MDTLHKWQYKNNYLNILKIYPIGKIKMIIKVNQIIRTISCQ